MADGNLNDRNARTLEAKEVLSGLKGLVSSGDVPGARRLFESMAGKFEGLLDDFGHPFFAKEFLRLLVDNFLWDDANDYLPKAGKAGGDNWHEILIARSYARYGDELMADYWWWKVAARLPNDREAKAWLQRNLK